MNTGKLWPYITTSPSLVIRQYIEQTRPSGMLLMDNTIPLVILHPDIYSIGRSMKHFPDSLYLPHSENDCYEAGVGCMMSMLHDITHAQYLHAVMGPNERHPGNEQEARRLGAYEAGCAAAAHAYNIDYIGGNWSTGTPEDEIIVWWLQGYGDNYRGYCPDFGKFKIGYHGYTPTLLIDDAPYFEQRYLSWHDAMAAVGLPEIPVIMTEAGFDAGPVENNGYRDRVNTADYAKYLSRLPALCPDVEGFCVFLLQSHDTKWDSFEFIGNTELVDSITNINNGMEVVATQMTYDRDRLWAEYQAILPTIPAFEKYRLTHPELGSWIDGSEWDVGNTRFRRAIGGIVYCTIGDWGNVKHTNSTVNTLPLAL